MLVSFLKYDFTFKREIDLFKNKIKKLIVSKLFTSSSGWGDKIKILFFSVVWLP